MKLRALDLLILFYIFFIIVVVAIFGGDIVVIQKFSAYAIVLIALAILRTFRDRITFPPHFSFLTHVIKFLTDWHYIVLCLLFYSSLPQVNRLMFGRYFDDHIIFLEQAIFHSLPALWLKHYFSSKVLMEAVHIGYFSYYILIPLLGIPMYYFAKNKENFHHFIFTICLTFISCYVIYVIYPVSGPCYIYKEAAVADLQGYLFTNLTVLLHKAGSVRAAAFPSSHVAVATSFILLAFRYHKLIFKITLPLVILLFFGTFYPSYHFVIDAIAGLFYGIFIFLLSFPLYKLLNKSFTIKKSTTLES